MSSESDPPPAKSVEVSAIVSIVLSVLTALGTSYFWLVENRNEQPRLRTYWVSGPRTIDDRKQMQDHDTQRIHFAIRAQLGVANDSSLANAIIGIKIWVKDNEGKWALVRTEFDDDFSGPQELAINVAPKQVTPLLLWLWLETSAPTGEARAGVDSMPAFMTWVDQPLQLKVELRTLNDVRFTHIITGESYPLGGAS